ncbi:peptidyl-tRNA hydrolase [Blakeslea trispora]|nr:peptidyl-tRNA hydrolase [Blakeslea trispora]
MTSTRILLVGLGNKPLPNTRHNVGMMALDAIARSLQLTWSHYPSWKSDVTETRIWHQSNNETQEYIVTLLKPRKLMNVSGSCVAQAVKDLSFLPENIHVFHDDMQRDLGKVSLKASGSANGHNGIKSVIDHLKTHQFNRVRIGIGRPPADDRSQSVVSDFVLGQFTSVELDKLETLVYPLWTSQHGLELLCHKRLLVKLPKLENIKVPRT